MNTGKVLLGALAGITAGALVGVLLAPAKGSETRKKYAKMGEDFSEKIKNKFNKSADDVADKYDETMREASEFSRRSHARTRQG
jgi:gas vesicle protein